MKSSNRIGLSNVMVIKLITAFFVLMVVAGSGYVLTTAYLSNRYFEESLQKLHSNLANHLIEEKFGDTPEKSPYLDDGSPNKAFFGDLMHDMMAVNRGIEVYLLDEKGKVDYSVVLDHSRPATQIPSVDLGPVKEFITGRGSNYILGDSPRDPDQQKVFSAAAFESNGKKGFIYIVLTGRVFDEVNGSLLESYFFKTGIRFTALTVVFTFIIGIILILLITRSLSKIVFHVTRFKEGDLESRVPNAEKNDLAELATSFNSMASTIVKHIDEVKSVDTLRRELIANVSHDLRTPLAIMLGYIETLQIKDEALTGEERKTYINTIKGSATKLSRLVTQLFEYSKLEAKQVEPQKEPFQIKELIQDIRYKNKVLADHKNIELSITDEGTTPLVFADISLVERAIQNLIDNALKFTPEGGKVDLSVAHDKELVFIKIMDDGPGIPEDQKNFIFERYRQDEKNPQQKQGMGLGLAIVKKIMEIHDSTIEVMNSPAGGTTFQLSLHAYSG